MSKSKFAVIKTFTCQTLFLPLIDLVLVEKLKPGDLIDVNKNSYPILDALSIGYDSHVKSIKVDERSIKTYTNIDELNKQIKELTKACFLKLARPSLVQTFIDDGVKLVRDVFELAKEKASTIIFIDELDAIETKRFDSTKCDDREVQRTMLELLNQLDGFESTKNIKVIMATNRIG